MDHPVITLPSESRHVSDYEAFNGLSTSEILLLVMAMERTVLTLSLYCGFLFNLAKFLMTTFQHYTNARLAFDADLNANTDYCLSFWYHISGYDAGKLQLFYTQTITSGQPDWCRDGNYSDHWY